MQMFGEVLRFNLEKKRKHTGEDCLIETSVLFICKCMIFIFKDVKSLLNLQPRFHSRLGYLVHN